MATHGIYVDVKLRKSKNYVCLAFTRFLGKFQKHQLEISLGKIDFFLNIKDMDSIFCSALTQGIG